MDPNRLPQRALRNDPLPLACIDVVPVFPRGPADEPVLLFQCPGRKPHLLGERSLRGHGSIAIRPVGDPHMMPKVKLALGALEIGDNADIRALVDEDRREIIRH